MTQRDQPTTRTAGPPHRPGRWTSALALAMFFAAVATVAFIGSRATTDDVQGWYADAERPWYTPPDWLFGPVWTLLYAIMAVAAWLVWRRRDDHPARVRQALTLWWVQLVINLAWTPVFFALQWLWPALIVVLVLDVLVAWTAIRFAAIDRLAGWLLVPYLAWVLYATALNLGIAILN